MSKLEGSKPSGNHPGGKRHDAPGLMGRLWLHFTLVCFAVIFLFPFVWMLLTSAKTDEELAAGRWLPAMPVFRAQSPYDAVDPAGKTVKASLALLQLQLRSQDAQIFNLIDGRDIASKWVVESGDAKLISTAESAQVQYRFADSDASPIVLRYDFDFPCDSNDLHKLILALRADDSWHRVDATLNVGEAKWESTRSTYLVQHRPMSILFQPPTFDDQTYQAKMWVPR